jgi:putative ABC transport system ATP-binding protein
LLSLIELKNISKTYFRGDVKNTVLKGVDLSIATSELLAIVGTSGSGKSTLMNIVGLLDIPSAGDYWLNGRDMTTISAHELSIIRNQQIGFIFQSYFMLPRLSILQNVGLPLTYREMNEKLIDEEAHNALGRVGIDHLAHRYPRELSGGQMQRAAIARALVGKPNVILADEPTGALDSKVGQEIMDLFVQLNQVDKNTIVIITHDNKLAKQCPRIIKIQDGLIVHEEGDL